jgi:hypothetical protein
LKFTLMHKNVAVVYMDILPDTGRITNIYMPIEPAHLPIGTLSKDGVSRKALDDWWSGRSIPASREGIEHALARLDGISTSILVTRRYGLSLSDHYWISPAGAGLTWEDINFFTNDFSRDMGEILFLDPSQKILLISA